MQICVWDLESVAIIPLGQDEFAFSSNVTGHVLCTLIKTSSFERTEEEIYCALEKTTFVNAFSIGNYSSEAEGLCARALMSDSFDGFGSLSACCNFLPCSGLISLWPFQHRAEDRGCGGVGQEGLGVPLLSFSMTARSLLMISFLENPTTLSYVWPEFLPVL